MTDSLKENNAHGRKTDEDEAIRLGLVVCGCCCSELGSLFLLMGAVLPPVAERLPQGGHGDKPRARLLENSASFVTAIGINRRKSTLGRSNGIGMFGNTRRSR